MFSKPRFAVVGLLLVAAAGSAQTTAVAAPATGPVVTASGRFTPLTPVRILDTRSGL
ncbi:MAG: hypothetical protein JWL70_2040, partial [Acidimicrobiia bacterium]|nr:hypothetical protein [Acidimicrobiia bacterium]